MQMENISLAGKTNFFEKRVGDYQKSGVMTSSKKAEEAAASSPGQEKTEDESNGINFDEDF